MTTITPEVLWAQRSNATDAAKNVIYLTVKIYDPKNLKINLTSSKLSIESDSGDDDRHYSLDIDFFKDIDVDNSKYDSKSSGNHISFVLRKKEAQEEFWPRLTKEKVKLRWLKTDFEKWVDEDEQEEVPEEPEMPGGMDMSSMMGGAGGAGGMPDMSSLMGGAGGAGGMPDLSSMMGGMGGAGGAGGMPDLSALMGGMGGAGGMPDLSNVSGMGESKEEFSSSDDEEEVKAEKKE